MTTLVKHFSFCSTKFVMDIRPGAERGQSSSDEFLIVKTDKFLDFYQSLLTEAPRRIVEIGMFEGGSLVYFDKLFQPERIVGVDLRKPIPALERYCATNPQVRTHYGISQTDPALPDILSADLDGEADLIVDDASHSYQGTRQTFLNCFKLLRPGGLYIIEDWSWSHKGAYQDPVNPRFDQPALTNLIFELVVETAVSRKIGSLKIYPQWAVIEKAGSGALVPAARNCLRGRDLPRI